MLWHSNLLFLSLLFEIVREDKRLVLDVVEADAFDVLQVPLEFVIGRDRFLLRLSEDLRLALYPLVLQFRALAKLGGQTYFSD